MRLAAFAPIAVLIGACGTQDLRFDDAVDAGPDAADDAGACASDADCRLPRLDCNPETRQCAGCVRDDQCQAPYGFCNTGLCVQCNADGDCHGGTCEPTSHRCVCDPRTGPCCTSDTSCAGNRSARVCDVALGQCVQCVIDSDCYSGEVCNPTTGRCVDCLTDQNCGIGQACLPAYYSCFPTSMGGFEGGAGPGNYVGADARVGP